MSSPVRKKMRQRYTDVERATYVSEALQSGDHKAYAFSKRIPERTLKEWLTEYYRSDNKENWSPNSKRRLSHRVFTDSTEKAATDQWREKYQNSKKPSDYDTLAGLLMQEHNKKYPERVVLNVANSTISRIKQQYRIVVKRIEKRKRSACTVDDSVLSGFQTVLNEVFVDYEDRDLIMNSDATRVPQSLMPVNTLCTVGEHANIDIGCCTNHVAGAMCTCTAAGNILPIYFTVPESQVYKFGVEDETQQVVKRRPKQKAAPPSVININGNNNNVTVNNITNNITNNVTVNVFNIAGNTRPVLDHHGNKFTANKSGTMNHAKLIEFIDEIIVEHTQDRPAALFLDSLGYQHNADTIDHCNKHNITVYKVPANTTAWLQPCDVLLFGPTKQIVRAENKRRRQLDIEPVLRNTCDQFSVALHQFKPEQVRDTWYRLRVSTPTQLRDKSSSSNLQRTRSTPIRCVPPSQLVSEPVVVEPAVNIIRLRP